MFSIRQVNKQLKHALLSRKNKRKRHDNNDDDDTVVRSNDVNNNNNNGDDDDDDDDTDGGGGDESDDGIEEIGRSAPVYLSAVLERLTKDVLTSAGNMSKEKKKRKKVSNGSADDESAPALIDPQHIKKCFSSIGSFRSLMSDLESQQKSDDRIHLLRAQVVVVDGNFGAGKTEFANDVCQLVPFAEAVCENLDQHFVECFWRMKEFSFAHQMYLTTNAMGKIRESLLQINPYFHATSPLFVVDRGFMSPSALAVQAHVSEWNGQSELVAFQRVFTSLVQQLGENETCPYVVYVDVEPHECYTTMLLRHPTMEMTVEWFNEIDSRLFQLVCRALSHEDNRILVKTKSSVAHATRMLCDRIEGIGPKPRVQVMDYSEAMPPNDAVLYTCGEDFANTYTALSSGAIPAIAAKIADSALPTVYVHLSTWMQPCANTFKRVIMYHFSENHSVVFYNNGSHNTKYDIEAWLK